MTPTRNPPVSVAIVGAGPAGLFAAQALLAQSPMPVTVDVMDRLPSPYGLVRYGVAPDHPTIKSVVSTLHEILLTPGARFVGGVDLDRTVTRGDLRASYNAVVYATGAPADRKLGIPGEELPGSISATALVSWYNGHPDAVGIELAAESVAVIGAGNVALDIGRILTRPYAQLAATDIPTSVLSHFAAAPVREVHLIARRGPEHAKFSTKELRELGSIDGTSAHVDPRDFATVPGTADDRRVRANLAVFRDWSERPACSSERRVRFHFYEKPVAVLGDGRVEEIQLERTIVDASGRVTGSGRYRTVPVQLVVRAVGYRGMPVADLPFDSTAGVVPNIAGRVIGPEGVPLPGEYVAGWLKRGPTGVIGTNKVDARETVASLLDDWADGQLCASAGRPRLEELLRRRGIPVTGLDGWLAIDAAELRMGAAEGRARSKIADWKSLNELAGAVPRC